MPYAANLNKEQRARVEAFASRLYDKYNPRADIEINVSKQDCSNEAIKKLFPKRNK